MRYASCEDDAMSYLNLGFYKMLNNLKKYKSHTPFVAWAKRVVINATIDEMRRNKRYKTYEEVKGVGMPEVNGVLTIYDDGAISSEDVYLLIQQLPPMTASVFNLYALDGYKHQEIAKMLKIKEGTSKWHYAEAKKRLRDLIEKTEIVMPYLEKITK
jgi:RNA polymerase sigma-70 factor (ECF subfamily)